MRTIFLVAILLCGCTTLRPLDLSITPPDDWPVKDVQIQYLEPGTVPPMCAQYANHTNSCAVVNFRTGVCYIYLTTKSPEVLEHERGHCNGYDHVGDTNRSRKAWEQWKAKNR
jgi:hypothetical protein